ncbi:hypothetical protein R1sor_010349 [Riccia sorocarpa]|uniref:Uncharacterized protein n=1 Tax=Riccia sorocarpa TaxID=122646 RepID=A0ABD3HXR2_9MARC
MLGENQQVDSFYSEVTPKPLKKVKKFMMEMSEDEETPPPTPSVADQTPPPQPEVRDMELHMEEVLEDLASTWKSKALEAVNGFLKPISTYIIPTPPTVDPEVENLKILVKEIKETLFLKYLATLRSKIEDVTCIAKLEAHMEGLGLDIPEKVAPSPAEALCSQLLAQMEGLARVLLGEGEGPAASFKWTHGTREELMTPVAIPDSLEAEIGGSSSTTAEAYEAAKRTEQSKERRKPPKGRTTESGSSESKDSNGTDTDSNDEKTRKSRKKKNRSRRKRSSSEDTSSEESEGSYQRARKGKTRERADIDTLTKELADLKVQIVTPKDKRRDPKAVRHNLWCANCELP